MTEITQADREALAAIDDALGFLTDPEREVVLQSFARHRAAAVAYPDIGDKHPMQLSREEMLAGWRERLKGPYVIQQKEVPDQAALVWRWDIGRALHEHARLYGRNDALKENNTALRAKLDGARGLLGEWAQWLAACNEGDDCEYLNGPAWDDADGMGRRTGAFLSGEAG